jgi:hypothetical protein
MVIIDRSLRSSSRARIAALRSASEKNRLPVVRARLK